MRLVLAVLLWVALSSRATADYVEVRRSATIKEAASGDAAIVARPAVGTNLVLAEPGQTPSGYYHVHIPAGLGTSATQGFVHRSLVRGFPGDPPDASAVPASRTGAGSTVSPVPASTPTSAVGTSAIVYRGLPRNAFPEFPITVLQKEHFVVGYSEDFMNPAWVFYRIGAAADFRSFPRPTFRKDDGTTSRVTTQAYSHSGFDRGHMAPNFALGSRFGPEGAKSTFVMSNVAPQFHSFNDGQWGDLEEWIAGRKPSQSPSAQNFIRGWADELGEVWVVVGPIFDEERDPLPAGIPVPSAFFCIVVDELPNGTPRALAFIMPHVDERVDELTGFLTSVDEVEERSGLDFFHELSDSVEGPLESGRAAELWALPVPPN